MAESSAPKIESQDLSIGSLFKDFYSVPDFQREYVWQREQVERLLQDIYDEFYDEDGELTASPEYFMGSIVACKADDGTYQLIDGQQRMTTFYLVLCAIAEKLRELGAPPSKVLDSQIASAATDPRTYEEVERFRVSLQYEESEGVLDKIASGVVDLGDPSQLTPTVRNILSARQDIRDFLGANLSANPAKMKEFHGALTTRVKLIRIITPSIANALKVFETINDRGVGLNAMDLLKNLLFIKTKAKDYARLKDRWKHLVDTLDRCGEKPLRFLRYYVMANFEIDYRRGIREDEIYDWLSSNKAASGVDQDPLSFLEKLIEAARVHANYLAYKDPAGNESRYLRNIAFLGGALRQQYILLMAASSLPGSLFERLCHAVENLFFCYVSTREPTKTFERNFARWALTLRNVSNEMQLEEFISRYLMQDMASHSDRFDFVFREMAQGSLQHYRLRYVLAKLTQYIDESAWGNPGHGHLEHYLTSNVELEHILPVNPREDVRLGFDKLDDYDAYVGRLGNLALLEKTINSSVSNGSFSEKSHGYKQSLFLLTKALVEKPQVGVNTQLNRAVDALVPFNQWDSRAIELRQQMLADLARKVWDIPEPKGRDSFRLEPAEQLAPTQGASSSEAIFAHRALLITINRSAKTESYYEATRYAWKLDPIKAATADIVLAVVQGEIVAAFVAEAWMEAVSANFPGRESVPGRFGFNGREADVEVSQLYVGKKVPESLRKRGAANPIRYTWE
jgi:hypothetical protein